MDEPCPRTLNRALYTQRSSSGKRRAQALACASVTCSGGFFQGMAAVGGATGAAVCGAGGSGPAKSDGDAAPDAAGTSTASLVASALAGATVSVAPSSSWATGA